MRQSLAIVLSGDAGQGLQTIEDLLVHAASKAYYVFSAQEVMSRVRGGNNTLLIRLAKEEIHAYQQQGDLIFLLNDHASSRLKDRVHEAATVFGESVVCQAAATELGISGIQAVNFEELAKQAGSAMYMSTLVFGYIAGMLELDQAGCLEQIDEQFRSKEEKIRAGNKNAFDIGYKEGKLFPADQSEKLSWLLDHPANGQKKEKGQDDAAGTADYGGTAGPGAILGNKRETYKILDGSSAVGIGALAGGCNFVASYPMSPGTGVLTYLAGKGTAFDVLVEQAEDEIAALNMVLGAWYAGARGLVTTSGGGFDLMQEAVSLAGITETPCVIHIGQRPGPGTGLPTRTEQADLNLAIYAGHGEFPRIVLALGTKEEAVRLTQKAFYLADRYQVPVIILTDQFLLDSFEMMASFELEPMALETFITKTNKGYNRYAFTDDGISPRGIPGYGQGLVKQDSDEHDEYGMITESFDMRVRMHEKRLMKEMLIVESALEPELIGPADYSRLIVSWGSTYGVLKEFIETGNQDKTALLHIKQVFPLQPSLGAYFKQAKTIIVVENNATGQMADLLFLKLNVQATHRILKYDGAPFSIEEIEKRLGEEL